MYINVVVLLVECGALVGMKNCWGKTPLDVAFNPSVRLLLHKHVRRLERGDFTDYERHLYREKMIAQWSDVSYCRLWRMATEVMVRQHRERAEMAERATKPRTPPQKRKRITAMELKRQGKQLQVHQMEEEARAKHDPWGLYVSRTRCA